MVLQPHSVVVEEKVIHLKQAGVLKTAASNFSPPENEVNDRALCR